jgi:GR25 family glycosyltransferase involved in LPS biosynthesis
MVAVDDVVTVVCSVPGSPRVAHMRQLLTSLGLDHQFTFDIGCFVSKDSAETGTQDDVFLAHSLTYTKTLAWFLAQDRGSHCLVLEDDIVPNPEAPFTVREAIEAVPATREATYLESCYMDCSGLTRVEDVGAVRFAVGANAMCTAAVLWSRSGAASFLAWIARTSRRGVIDHMTDAWNWTGVDVAIAVPQAVVQDRATFGGVSEDGTGIDYRSCVPMSTSTARTTGAAEAVLDRHFSTGSSRTVRADVPPTAAMARTMQERAPFGGSGRDSPIADGVVKIDDVVTVVCSVPGCPRVAHMRQLLASLDLDHRFTFDIGCFVPKDSAEAHALRPVWIGTQDDAFRAHSLTYTKTLAWFLAQERGTHCLVLEDDIVPNPEAPFTVRQVLQAVPASRDATYLEWCYMKCTKRLRVVDAENDVKFAVGATATCTAAVLWSRPGAASLLAWMARASQNGNIDESTEKWNRTGVDVAFTVPQAVVQNRATFGGVSVVAGNNFIDYRFCGAKSQEGRVIAYVCVGAILGGVIVVACLVAVARRLQQRGQPSV